MGRRVARGNQQRGSKMWHMIKHMSEGRRVHMRDVLDIEAKKKCSLSSPFSSRKTSKCYTDPSEEFNSNKFQCSLKIPSTAQQTGFAQE